LQHGSHHVESCQKYIITYTNISSTNYANEMFVLQLLYRSVTDRHEIYDEGDVNCVKATSVEIHCEQN